LLYRFMTDQTVSLTDVCTKLRDYHMFSLASIDFDHGRIHSFFSPRLAGRSCYCGHSAPAVAGRTFHCLFIGSKSVHGKASRNWKVGEPLLPVSVTENLHVRIDSPAVAIAAQLVRQPPNRRYKTLNLTIMWARQCGPGGVRPTMRNGLSPVDELAQVS
jgi:hypothetical protein